MKIDLHNHTKYSDGVYTTLELFNAAKNNGVDIFALTDHDSVFGCEEILKLDNKDNIRIILGMELSTYYKGHSVHIVSLFKNNIIPERIFEFSKDILEKRKIRALKMMEAIRDIYNLKIDLEELFANSEIITRGNMLRNIVKCNNLSFDEARFYISNESKAYIPSTKLPTQEGLKLVKECGCIAILAHPCLLPKSIVEELVSFEFDGIEAKYPLNKEGDYEFFLELSKKYNLLISAGSDDHGDGSHSPIGTSTLTREEFLPLAERIGFNYGN